MRSQQKAILGGWLGVGPGEQGRYRGQLRSVQRAWLPLLLVAMTNAEGYGLGLKPTHLLPGPEAYS